MKNLILLSLLLLTFNISIFAQQFTITGKVVEIVDGSTLKIDANRTHFTVRLQFIDPPEKTQPLYETVKNHLSGLTMGKEVSVRVRSSRNGIHIGRVTLNGIDLSMQLLRDGAAWYSIPEKSSQHETERNLYMEIESQAKADKLGVWGIEDITPAWMLRLERENADAKQREEERRDLALKMASSAMVLPTKPVIGMTLTEFNMLCKFDPSDGITTSESERGMNITLQLSAVTEKRLDSMCFGTFSFDVNRKLTSIVRTKL